MKPLHRLIPLLALSALLGSTPATAQQAPIQTNENIANKTYSNTTVTEAAVENITTSGNVTIGGNATVTFEAGQKIVLSPGFRTTAGANFRAQIGLSAANLDRLSASDGAPAGLSVDSNNNGISDYIERGLGLDPRANNDSDPRIQNMQNGGFRNYTYDANNQLSNAGGERAFANDPEGNISNH